MRVHPYLKQPGLLLPLAALLILFQNCSGFTGASFLANNSASSTSGGSSSSPSQVAAVTQAVSGMEWQPMAVKVTSSLVLSAKSLPTGALYDASSKTFLWLPKVGQAGSYGADFVDSSGNLQLHLALNIGPISAANISNGPIDSTADGDVGYVFIHGMGQENYCNNAADLTAYWDGSPAIIARTSPVTLGCYDSTQAADTVAPTVAQEIVNANCGRFNKCILVTHSMGGLVAELILTHDRAAVSTDPEADLFANAALYAQAKAKVLSVISIASAAGGADTATVLESPTQTPAQIEASQFANALNLNTAAVQGLTVARASDILAPMTADPGVPVYMIPGYTTQTSGEAGITTSQALIQAIPLTVYDSSTEYAALDPILLVGSRSDGLVEFRSGCGIASDVATAGPGYTAALSSHLAYCYSTAKKPEHYLWFATNMNHSLSPTPWANCNNTTNPCQILEPNATQATLVMNTALKGVSAVAEMRTKLDSNRVLLGSAIATTVTIP